MYIDILKSFKPTYTAQPHESIRESVETLLNARKGSVSYSSTFGTPDFRDSICTDYAEKLKTMVLSQIRRNEPRISHIVCESFNIRKSLSAMRYELQVTLKTQEVFDLNIETTGAGQFHVYL